VVTRAHPRVRHHQPLPAGDGNILRVEEGSLYPALHRLDQEGLIESEWCISETSRRARYYRLTRKGRRQLETEEEKWAALTGAVARVLKFV